MGRKELRRLTKKGREKLREKVGQFRWKLTEIENKYENIYDLEEAIHDNLKAIFACDADCSTCSIEDLKICHQEFRKANIFWVQKLRYYDEILLDYIEYLIKFSQELFKLIEVADEEDEGKKKEETDEAKSLYL